MKYEKVLIKSKDDLPKEKMEYYFHDKVLGGVKTFTCPNLSNLVTEFLANDCDWYLQPIPESPAQGMPSDEEVAVKAHQLAEFTGFDKLPNHNVRIEVNCIRMADWFKSRLAPQDRRAELVKFARQFYPNEETINHYVDEYLKETHQ
jgi:hypothetical protein